MSKSLTVFLSCIYNISFFLKLSSCPYKSALTLVFKSTCSKALCMHYTSNYLCINWNLANSLNQYKNKFSLFLIL